ncbi:MAG TPA: NUDIX domain-containing protein [Candidatus Paceibacterota bacterium]|nr:NUDIX domain-containing protein [Candidatus Paceibacterota bacterium]
MNTLIHGRTVEVTGEHAEEALQSHIFTEWKKRLSPWFSVRKIEFQSVDFTRHEPRRVIFAKFKAEVYDNEGKLVMPGIVFLRGGAVAMLVVFHCEGEEYTVLTNQPRFASGSSSFPEIAAGMLDGEGNFAGVAAREMEEELGITIKTDELVDLTHLANSNNWPGMFPSPGACDEFIRIFLYEREITREKLEEFRGKTTGLASENERIKLSVIPLRMLPFLTPDGKSLAAYCLYLATGRAHPSADSQV